MRLRKRLKYNKRKYLYLSFIVLIFTITLGYSLLSTNLSIEGVGKVSSARWDIHFENIQTTQGSVTPVQAPTISNDTNITFSVKLAEPTNFYEFTADIVNEGTIDAKINSFTILPVLTEAQKKYFNYTVTYSNGTEIKINDALNAGTTEKIKVRFEYLEQTDTSLYPTEDQEFTFEVDIDYVQGKGEEVEHITTVTKYRTLPYKVVYIGDNVSEGVTLFDTVAEAKAAFNNRPFYLKHEIENDIVKESYVCFEKEGNTYCLQGQHTYESGAPGNCKSEYYDSENNKCISTYYESNKTILKQAFGESNCTPGSSSLSCSVSGLSAYAYGYGKVYVLDDSEICLVNDNGGSYC